VTRNDIELAIAAADAGAAVVRAMYGGQLTQFEKSPTDFATDADVEAERVILNLLRAARPDDQLVGEESGTSADGASGRTWLVDPLCGTLNYAAQTPLVAVNVALRINGRSLLRFRRILSAVNYFGPTAREGACVSTDARNLYALRRGRHLSTSIWMVRTPMKTGFGPSKSWPTPRSPRGLDLVSRPPRSRWRGSRLAAARPTSPMVPCSTACISPAESQSAKGLGAW